MILTTLETQPVTLDEIELPLSAHPRKNPMTTDRLETFDFDSLGIEIFWAEFGEILADDESPLPAGWYWWSCFPGCLPDSEPFGPFPTSHEAKKNAGLR